MNYMKILRVAGSLALAAILLACPLSANAAGYRGGHIDIVSEPDAFSTDDVTYYVGDRAAAASEMVWVEDGHTGKAVKLSGNGEFLRLGYSSVRVANFTFSAWVNWQGAVNGVSTGQRLFTIARSKQNYLTLSPYMRDTGLSGDGGFLNGLYMRFQHGGERGNIVNMFNPTSDVRTYALPQREWHHVAVVSDGRTIKLYLDGVRWFEKQLLTSVAELNAYSLDIGAGEWGDPTLNALLDDVTVFNSALNATKIAELAGANDAATYLPTAPSSTSTTATEPIGPNDTTETTGHETLDKTLFGVPMWGIYIIIGVIVVYMALAVLLSVRRRRQMPDERKDGRKKP